jgi:hypothetical protein
MTHTRKTEGACVIYNAYIYLKFPNEDIRQELEVTDISKPIKLSNEICTIFGNSA